MCSTGGSAWFAQFTGTQLVDAGFWLLRLKINGALFSTHAAHMHKWHTGRKNNKTTSYSFEFRNSFEASEAYWHRITFLATKMTFSTICIWKSCSISMQITWWLIDLKDLKQCVPLALKTWWGHQDMVGIIWLPWLAHLIGNYLQICRETSICTRQMSDWLEKA